MAALVQEKKRLFILWDGPRKSKCQETCRCKKRCRCGTCKCRKKMSVFGHPQDVNADLESMKENYNRARRAAKLAIFNAKNAEKLKFCEELEDVDRKGNVFRVAKQLVKKNIYLFINQTLLSATYTMTCGQPYIVHNCSNINKISLLLLL